MLSLSRSWNAATPATVAASDRRGPLLVVFLLSVFSLLSCQKDPAGREVAGAGSREIVATMPPAGPTTFVSREFWLALAEEPKQHLDAARSLLLEDRRDLASLELAKVAAILNFESSHSHSAREEDLLLAAVRELRRMARALRAREPRGAHGDSPPPLLEVDRSAALALHAVAAHQVALARDALEAGDARMAGTLSRETARVLESGFERARSGMALSLRRELEWAREVGFRMEVSGEGSLEESLVTLDRLDAAVTRLGDTLKGEIPEDRTGESGEKNGRSTGPRGSL